MTAGVQVWQVAVPSPVYRGFDYLPPKDIDPGAAVAGARVRVPFGRGTRVGIITATAASSCIAVDRLKRVHALLDTQPVLPPDVFRLLLWAANYYHHPAGEVLLGALPALLRRGEAVAARPELRWCLSAEGRTLAADSLRRAPRQLALMQTLAAAPDGITAQEVLRQPGGGDTLRRLRAKGWVESREITGEEAVAAEYAITSATTAPVLNDSQRAAAAAIDAALDRFQPFLLDGVTGSGKTEVYFHAVEGVLRKGRQALLMVPEIGLTPQMIERVRHRFAAPLAVLHSGLPDRERLAAWRAAADGSAPIVIGTRSAVFVPLARPGVIIVDEEHDASYKQQEGFRYHARDLAVVRARLLNVPVVLGSATPALESLHNCRQDRYRHLILATRAGAAVQPEIRLVSLRDQVAESGISPVLAQAIERHLARDHQVLLFLNRRGYAPTLLCHDCGWVASCPRCDAHLIYHHAQRQLRCHHCDAQRAVPAGCPGCGSPDLRPLGQGTERAEEVLAGRFPAAEIVRIDRDSTRRKGSLDALMRRVQEGRRQILLGTQMLTKGHHLPHVTLVGILDADQGLFGADFRASERMGQLIVQVAGRAGRADNPGEVLIQTHHPDHPQLAALLRHDYQNFARSLLDERRQAGLPPYGCLALLRAESVHARAPRDFLAALCAGLPESVRAGVEILGPAPPPMERRAGRHRAQLLFHCDRRAPLHHALAAALQRLNELPQSGKVRWTLDVDPIDEY
ncbi:MAG: primosomal protein N' [Gammaproteobacteria bacterium]